MNLRKILLIGVAATGIAAVAVAPSYLPEARAATSVNVSIDIGTFYDRLDPYGDWIWYHGRYVWVPDRIGARWRPYIEGHWVYTRRHGWYWVSDEPFGWAAYHYGRWGYSRRIGWFWLPGRRWAPAWVAWHHTDRHVAWAPLPPDWDDDDDVNISVSFGTVPDIYWQVVPFNVFLSVDISDHVIRDRDRVREVVRRGEPTVVHIENNIVVNNFIDIDVIEEKTDKKVVVHEAKPASDPEAAGKTEGETVAVFDAEVKEDPVAKPKKVTKVEEVEKKHQATASEEPAADEPVAEEPPTTEEGQPPAEEAQDKKQDKKKKKVVPEAVETQPASTGEEQPAVTTEEQPVKKKKKKAVQGAEEGQQPAAEAPAEEQPVTTEEQPVKKKKKKAVQGAEEGQQPAADAPAEEQPVTTEDQPVKKKKKAAQSAEKGEQPAAEANQQKAPAEESAAGKSAKKKKRDTGECDPAVQDCAQAY